MGINREQQEIAKISGGIFCSIILVLGIDLAIVNAEINPQNNRCSNLENSSQDHQAPMSQSQTERYTHQEFNEPGIGENKTLSQSLMKNHDNLQKMVNTHWSRMLAALVQGNVEQALQFIMTNQRNAVRENWTTIHNSFSSLAKAFEGPLLLANVYETQLIAQAVMSPAQASLQCPIEVNFILDPDGEWRIKYF